MLANSLRLARLSTSSRTTFAAVQQRTFIISAAHQKSFPALVQEIKATNKNIHYLSPKDLHSLKSETTASASTQPPHVIDVRERHEVQATGTIPGAIVLPRGILERDVAKFIKQSDPRDVVVYCAGGFRSVLAAESLVRLGYGVTGAELGGGSSSPKVWSLDEGMDGWVKNGFQVEKDGKVSK
ncbi:MAG: rhodanese domain-containing protein [Linnemannia gamsii]|nr:MAG: rhodanese domain-containing protein [Linnemannia gamsii]